MPNKEINICDADQCNCEAGQKLRAETKIEDLTEEETSRKFETIKDFLVDTMDYINSCLPGKNNLLI